MSSLRQRLKALRRGQDATCEACWDEYITALLKCAPALERHGVPADVADRCFDDDLTSDEVAQIEAALPHMQAEVEAVNKTQARFAQIEGACGSWMEREIEAKQREIAQYAATDLTLTGRP